jgi:hypothetical protein
MVMGRYSFAFSRILTGTEHSGSPLERTGMEGGLQEVPSGLYFPG